METVEEACSSCGRSFLPPRITPRDVQVLNLLVTGKGNPEIAKAIGVTTGAIKHCISRLILKLQISSERYHHRIRLAYLWSCPIFRIGAGYESPTPTLAADVIVRDRMRAEKGSKRPIAAD